MIILIFILKLILYVILAFILFLILMLILPFTYSCEMATAGTYRFLYQISWPWKLIKVDGSYNQNKIVIGLSIMNKYFYKINKELTKREKAIEKSAEENDYSEDNEKSFDIKTIFEKEFIGNVLDYLKKLFKTIKPKYMIIKGKYGFDDPSITGMVCGAVEMVKACFPKANILLSPSFTEEIIDIDMKVQGSFLMGTLAYQTLITIMKKPIRSKIFKRKR